MTRLVLVADLQALSRFERRAEDLFVPLHDRAEEALIQVVPQSQILAMPPGNTLHSEARAEAFSTASGILAALDQDAAWHALLRYRGHDLRHMALKNLYFELERLAIIRARVRLAADAFSGAEAVLLGGHPDTVRAVRAILPETRASRALVKTGRVIGAAWAKPLFRWAQARWWAWHGRGWLHSLDRPVICFMDAPDRARVMARTLALLATERPVAIALMNPFTWPPDVPFRPATFFPWAACTPRGAGLRVARHVMLSRARTDPLALNVPGGEWIPPRLLWGLRYDDLQRYANMLESFSGLAEALRPALWITLEDEVAFGKCAASVGERLGVPSVNVQHGIIGAFPYRTGADVAGMYAAFNAESRQELIARGAHPDRIVVTGPVRYDDIRDPACRVDRVTLLRDVGLDPARPVILFASQRAERLLSPTIKRRALHALLDGAAQIGGQVVIKPHPQESAAGLQALVRDFGASVPLVNARLYGWLHACDIVATVSATVVYEAAVAERPALVLEWTGNTDVAGYVEAGIARLPETPAQVGDALRALLDDAAIRAEMLACQRRFVADTLPEADGHASMRLANLARALMEKGGNMQTKAEDYA